MLELVEYSAQTNDLSRYSEVAGGIGALRARRKRKATRSGCGRNTRDTPRKPIGYACPFNKTIPERGHSAHRYLRAYGIVLQKSLETKIAASASRRTACTDPLVIEYPVAAEVIECRARDKRCPRRQLDTQ